MNRIELLAPAGDFESLQGAIANGANAIYLGTTAFSARAFAKNFNLEELDQAIQYAHLRNVRIFVTVNTLYQDDEMKDVLSLIDSLYELQIDALLIQDIGLLKLVHERYPDMELHTSTQMSVMSLEALRYFEDLGVKRVVLARENTIDEIKYICSHTDLEIEVFAHGALCVAYSGQCLMSSMIGRRSGNRGACAQPCRLPYSLEEDGKVIDTSYLMSTMDLCTSDHINEYIEAGVASLKIEGRMKRPEYVAAVTQVYSKAIKHYYENTPNYTKENFNDMKQMFNRHYTSGYPFHADKIVDETFSGNQGVFLGYVKGYDYRSKRVSIALKNDLTQGDSIVFTEIDKGRPVNKIYYQNKLINKAEAGMNVQIEFDDVVKGGTVNKTISVDTINRMQKTYQEEKKYRKIDMSFKASLNKPCTLVVKCDDEEVSVVSEQIIEEASKRAATKENIIDHLNKLGHTVYEANKIDVELYGELFIPITIINNMRREALSKLDALFTVKKHHKAPIKEIQPLKVIPQSVSEYHVVVSNIKQLEIALRDYDHVYYYYNADLKEALECFKKYDKVPNLYLPRIMHDKDIQEVIHNPLLKEFNTLIVNDFGSYRLLKEHPLIIGQGFNIYNHYDAYAFKEPVIASFECTRKQIKQMKDYNADLILPIYGKTENMISEHCVISQSYFHKKVPHCGMCKKHSYKIVDRKGVPFDIFTDDQCRNHILHNEPIYVENHQSLNISYFIMLTTEDENATVTVLEDIKKRTSKGKKSDLKKPYVVGYFK